MKLISLLKAALSQDMQIFKIKTNSNSTKSKKVLTPIFLFIVVCFSVSIYAYFLAEELAPNKLTYIVLTIFTAVATVITLMEGIYKSSSMLFNTKDNDLLFSLPIKKSWIVFVRIFKLLAFQYIYNLLFLLPAIVVYAIYEHPSLNYYLISFVMTILIPIIPTVVACLIGYISTSVSSKLKFKKVFQLILPIILLCGYMYFSFNTEKLVSRFSDKAVSINGIISGSYYPVKAYLMLITKFDILTFIKLILFNIIPLILFIFIISKFYFNVISKNNNYKSSSKNKKVNIKVNSPLIALSKKELKKYISSPTYILNSSMGILFLMILTCVLVFSKENKALEIISMYGISENVSMSFVYVYILLLGLFITNITACSISLEGKTINITKCLPVSENAIFKSKILTCYIIEFPFVLLTLLMVIIKFKPGILYILLTLILSILLIAFSAIMGLIINLNYPKLDYKNDVEVVKQSSSSFISILLGFVSLIVSIIILSYFSSKFNIMIALLIINILLTILILIFNNILVKKGTIKYKELSI